MHTMMMTPLTTTTATVAILWLLVIISLHRQSDILVESACSSCLVSSALGTRNMLFMGNKNPSYHMHIHNHHHHHLDHNKSFLMFLIARKMIATHFGYTLMSTNPSKHNDKSSDSTTTNHKDEEYKDTNSDPDTVEKSDTDNSEDFISLGMIQSIKFYKFFISPLLPPSCRFLPTCSIYGVQAIQEFGPAKGGILTAWRLLRCSPFGGRGYDPPKWPPVPYNYGSY